MWPRRTGPPGIEDCSGPAWVVPVGKQDNSLLGLDVTEGDRGRVMASLGATREGGGGT